MNVMITLGERIIRLIFHAFYIRSKVKKKLQVDRERNPRKSVSHNEGGAVALNVFQDLFIEYGRHGAMPTSEGFGTEHRNRVSEGKH